MKDLKLITIAGVTTALVASNLIIGKQYINDSKEYEQKIDNQYKIIKQYKENEAESKTLIHNEEEQINNLNTQLDQLKKENDELKKEWENRREMVFEVSFYTNGFESTQKHIGDKGYGLTASGTIATEGRTIAAPPSFPFGTRVYIEGIGNRIVEDRGGAISGNKLDVFVNSVDEARGLGKQKLVVQIFD